MLRLATKFAPQLPAMETAYRAGFHFAELWLDQAVLAGWQRTAEHAGGYPFGYAMHFPNRIDSSADALAPTVGLYRKLSSRCLVIHQPMCDKYCEGLLRLEPGLQLAIENGRLTPERFSDWAERNPGLALDVEHLWKFTLHDCPLEQLLDQVRTLLKTFGHKLRHVHLPGYWPGFREHRPMYCAREMIFPVLSLLAEAHFEGLVVSEANPEFQNAAELRMDVLLFEAWREQQGTVDPTSTP